MKKQYLQLIKLFFCVNSFLFAFGCLTLCFVMVILAAFLTAGVFYPALYNPELNLGPLILMVLTVIKFYLLWSVFSLCFLLTKSINTHTTIRDINLEPFKKIRYLLTATFFVCAAIYFLELPQFLGPFENFFRFGPTAKGLSAYTSWQSLLYFIFKIVFFEINGIVALVFGIFTFALELFVKQNRMLQNELEEVI